MKSQELYNLTKADNTIKLLDNYVITSTTNTSGVITDVSEAFCKISGYSKDELIGKPHNIVRHPDVKKSFFKKIWNDLENYDNWKGEIKNLKKNGEIYWVDTIISSNYNEKGIKTGYSSLKIEITDKKKLEEKNLELNSLKNTLSNAVKMANLGTWEWDVINNESVWTDILYKIYDVKIGTPINLELVQSKIYSKDLEKHKKSLKKCLEDKTPFNIEYRITKKDELRKLLVSANPVVRNNKVIKMIGVTQDITEIKELQEELEVAQEVAHIGHYNYNLKDDIFTCSKQIDKIFGINKDGDKTFDSWLNIIYEKDKKRIEKYFNKIIQTKKKFDNEYRIINRESKEIKWVHGLGEFSYDKNGNIITLYGTIQDISKRKKYEDNLKQALYIFENTYDAITVTDENVNIINVNKSFEKITGYTLNEVKGLNPRVLQSGIHTKEFYKNMWSDINNKGFWTGEITNKTKSGKLYEELLTITSILDKSGTVTNYIAIFTDISKQKTQEKLLLQQSRTSAVGEMLENIAHQWRQPLSIITTAATGFKLSLEYKENEEIDREELIKILTNINNQSQYLSKTIDDFRSFFKGDLTKNEIFSIQECLEKVKNLTKDSFSSNFITIIENIEKENILIDGNENILIQALINIFNNTKDVLVERLEKEEKYLFITVQKENKNVSIELSDNAGGIADNFLKKIFDPYFTTKHQSVGTGLGLYMTRKIITEQMNGIIEVNNIEFDYKNKNYRGANFIISIPIV